MMDEEFQTIPIPPEGHGTPLGANPPAGAGGNEVDEDDPFVAILDQALERAFRPIIEEYRALRERHILSSSTESPGPAPGAPEANPNPDIGLAD